jgi:hypothetical protein
MSTRTFTNDELNKYYNTGRIHHKEIVNVEPDEVTYTSILDTNDGRHYRLVYVEKLFDGVTIYTNECQEVFPAAKVEVSITFNENGDSPITIPANYTAEAQEIYEDLLKEAIEMLHKYGPNGPANKK